MAKRPVRTSFAVCLCLVIGVSGCAHKQQTAAVPPLVRTQPLEVNVPSKQTASCPSGIEVGDDHPFAAFDPPGEHSCKLRQKGGYLLPDPKCTPGAVNLTLTLAVLKDPDFKTDCVRNLATSAVEKKKTYGWYGQQKPADNSGQQQTCELDHLVPLYMGGADTLDNIWPQCGPDGVDLSGRYFKQKDHVELYLGEQVRQGKISLKQAQQGIAKDWTKYIVAAETFCRNGQCGKKQNAVGVAETDDY